MGEFIPKWQKELDIFDRIKPIVILEGNVLDKYQYPCLLYTSPSPRDA